ncbi:MAG: urease accessory protein UreF [Acidiphilium sp.]
MDEALAHLLTWLSPAFPTGGFAFSHGLEWAVEAGDVASGEDLRLWLADLLRHGAGRNDAILLRAACREDDLAAVAAFAAATAPSRELAAETLAQGAAFAAAAAPWQPEDLAARFATLPRLAHPVAFGALAASRGIDEEAAVLGWLHAFTANLISAGVRLIPLGQTAGLAVQQTLEPAIRAAVAATRGATLDDIGGCCLRAEIASMRHETQYTRLFRS